MRPYIIAILILVVGAFIFTASFTGLFLYERGKQINAPLIFTDVNNDPIDTEIRINIDYGRGSRGSFVLDKDTNTFPFITGQTLKIDLEVIGVTPKCIKSRTITVDENTAIYQKFDCYINKKETSQTTFCGDGICQQNEDCSSCEQDCDKCETPGKLSLIHIDNNDFWYIHAGGDYPEFIERISSNEFNVYIKTLKSEPYRPTASFIFRISNIGDNKVENIESTIRCDEISPTKNVFAISDSSKSYKGLLFDWSFWCEPCAGHCSCDNYPEGNKVNYLQGCIQESGISRCSRTTEDNQLIGPSIDKFLEFNVNDVITDLTLSCDIRVFAENPSQSISKTLIIHFFADR